MAKVFRNGFYKDRQVWSILRDRLLSYLPRFGVCYVASYCLATESAAVPDGYGDGKRRTKLQRAVHYFG